MRMGRHRFTIIALSALTVAGQDGWTLLHNFYTFESLAMPNCDVIDNGVITRETCEHFYARVGEEHPIQVSA